MKRNDKLISAAAEFAITVHHGQVRKYSGEPYFMHCAEVAILCAEANLPDECLAAAWLHDTVEDTFATIEDIQTNFGYEIAELVDWLTDVSKPDDGNRETRKALDRAHIAKAPAEAKSIKLADLISNTKSIESHDPDFARTYMKEKGLLLEVLTDGSRLLYDRAANLVDDYLIKRKWQIRT